MKKDCSSIAYLIKLVHIIGQQIDDLACGGLAHGHVTKAKCLKKGRERENHIPSLIPSLT